MLSAQESPGTPNELDNQYVPDKNSIFNSDAKGGEEGVSSAIDVKNIIKLNATMLPRGIFALYYQKGITDQISLEGGLGACFNKDRVFGFVSGISDGFSGNSQVVELNTIMRYGELKGTSLFYSLSFRVSWDSYYDNVTPYFSLNTRYYTNKLLLSQINDYQTDFERLDGTPEVIIRNTSFNIIYGYQYITDGKIRTTHDYYFGLGMRNTSFDEFISTRITPSSGDDYTLYSKTSDRLKVFAPSFIVGYAFGIGF